LFLMLLVLLMVVVLVVVVALLEMVVLMALGAARCRRCYHRCRALRLLLPLLRLAFVFLSEVLGHRRQRIVIFQPFSVLLLLRSQPTVIKRFGSLQLLPTRVGKATLVAPITLALLKVVADTTATLGPPAAAVLGAADGQRQRHCRRMR
jgi:hypothetical protein